MTASTSSFVDATDAHDHFSAQFDLEHPVDAISSYARIMREHTRRQMELAMRSASHHSAEDVPVSPTLTTKSSEGSSDSRWTS